MVILNQTKNWLLKMSDLSFNEEVRANLTAILDSLLDEAADSYVGQVAQTLLSSSQKHSRCYCSEKQAYIVARGLYEHCHNLY